VCICAALTAASLGFAPAASAARSAGSIEAESVAGSWTIALYVNGDNDLAYAWPRFTLPALKGIPASDAVRVVAMVDSPRRDGATLYRIAGRQVQTVRRWPGERDFGAGRTFRWFLQQVHATFPSDRLVVVGWDHGYGWRYFSRDFTAGDRILLPELRRAIEGAGVHIEVLGFDACNMADVDVAAELASTGLVDHLVASEETIDQDGYPYANMFAPLAVDPMREPDVVVADMLAGWTRYYASRRNFSWVSLSAVDMARTAAMRQDVAAWVARLRAGLPLYAARYQAAMHRTIYAWDSWMLDLGGFAARLAADPRIADAALRAASAAVRDDVAAAVVDVTSGSYASGFTGLTVWAGTGADWRADHDAYREQVTFGKPVAADGTGWYAFLRAFNASPACDRREPDPRSLPGRAAYGLSDVFYRDAGHGWATGFDNLSNTAFILRSAGAAHVWRKAGLGRLGNYLFSAVTEAPGGALWAVGDAGYHDAVIVRSTDGGRTWSTRRSTRVDTLFGVDFPSARTGWVCGARGTLLRSGDGGRSWKQVAGAPPGDLLALDFSDARRGWVAAGDERLPDARLLYTADGGRTWSATYTAPHVLLYGLEVLGAEVWAAGGDPALGRGVIVHGSAAGPWAEQWGGPVRLADVAMADPSRGWAVGDGGTVLRTTDGGATWAPQASGVAFDLTAVTALDAFRARAVGDGEGILVTDDGGSTWRLQTALRRPARGGSAGADRATAAARR